MTSKIKIEFYSGDGTVSEISAEPANNVSNLQRFNSDDDGYLGFYLGDDDNPGTPLGRGLFFGSEGYPGFNSKAVWDGAQWWNPETHTAAQSPQLAFTLSGSDCAMITVKFDKRSGEFPPILLLNGVNVEAENTEIVLQISSAVRCTLEFRSWSKRGVAKVSGIRVGYTAEYDSDKVYRILASCQDRPQTQQLEFGLTSQYADLSLFNNRAEFSRLADLGLLKENLPCEVWLGNVKIGEYLTSDYNIPGTESQAVVKCEDALRLLQETQYHGFSIKQINLYQILNDAISGLAFMPSFHNHQSSLILSSIISKDCFTDTESIYVILKKICEAAGCRMWNSGHALNIIRCS